MQWFHRRSTKCGRGRGRGRRTNSARISHPPPFRRVTKNDQESPNKMFACRRGRIWKFMQDLKVASFI